jgi:hypothetical protein
MMQPPPPCERFVNSVRSVDMQKGGKVTQVCNTMYDYSRRNILLVELKEKRKFDKYGRSCKLKDREFENL